MLSWIWKVISFRRQEVCGQTVLTVFRDIDAEKRQQEAAQTDALTGVLIVKCLRTE